MKLISIVTPCFNEEESIRECYETVRDIFAEKLPDYAYEHIFCDNASTDRTVAILEEIADADPSVKVIVNTRNFGPFRSNFNGVLNASGDAVLLFLPADLQDPPELIPEMVGHWEQGSEVVYGVRAVREESRLMNLMRKAYYRLLSKLTYVDIPNDVGDFQLVDRKVVDAMAGMKDSTPFMRVMSFEAGFRATGVSYTWRKRSNGVSKNRFLDLIDQGMTGLLTFSNVPLRISVYAGFLAMVLSFAFALVTLFVHIFHVGELAPPGIPTLIVSLFFFAGVQLFFLGLLGEYVLAIHGQVRGRPLVFERRRINFNDPENEQLPKASSNDKQHR